MRLNVDNLYLLESWNNNKGPVSNFGGADCEKVVAPSLKESEGEAKVWWLQPLILKKKGSIISLHSGHTGPRAYKARGHLQIARSPRLTRFKNPSGAHSHLRIWRIGPKQTITDNKIWIIEPYFLIDFGVHFPDFLWFCSKNTLRPETSASCSGKFCYGKFWPERDWTPPRKTKSQWIGSFHKLDSQAICQSQLC